MSDLTPVDETWWVARHAAEIISDVRTRLTVAGAVIELWQLDHLSAGELDLLVDLELAATPDHPDQEAAA